ncbi:hypothetical protein SARC_14605 [Sphaeroforma arctica JP610]|uniref:Chromo domain-containing protein n=1 Tax=Sphaeroforma arctica JP610 TaxID=667725 RepID=A0A0L0F7Y8_9EUKA|nr:hypothetical protein SARC_14605 [Sphaeroforma arctica JP610]KNC72835.1 hypothetical protein SARC_14605 [Sphaeroforma arctica JP610]|eukprot:XP_014146737.1 hypothetical protein SARC_14605 [Sphaeroforma arctica JP610]
MLYQNLKVSCRYKSDPSSVYFGRRHVPFSDFTDDTSDHQPVTNETWAQRLDRFQDTILPTLHRLTMRYTDTLTRNFDRLHADDLVHFEEGDVVMVKSEGRTSKAMRPLFGPYVFKGRNGHEYDLAHRDGSIPSEFKGRPVRVEVIRLVLMSTDPPLDESLWREDGSAFRHIIKHRMNYDTGQMEYLVRRREGEPTWETAEAFDDANDIVAYHKVTQTRSRKRRREAV